MRSRSRQQPRRAASTTETPYVEKGEYEILVQKKMTKAQSGAKNGEKKQQPHRKAFVGNVKNPKRVSSPKPAGAPRHQPDSRMRQPQQRMLQSHSASHLQAVQRYTSGPIVQLIQPINQENSMLVTQTVNKKSKKRKILVQYIVENKGKSSTNTSHTPDMKGVTKPPSSITQPAIATSAQTPSAVVPPIDLQHQKPQRESAFTKALKKRVIRKTWDLFDTVQQKDVNRIQMDDLLEPCLITVFDSPQKSQAAKDLSSQSNKCEAIQVYDQSRDETDQAATMLQSLLRGILVRKTVDNIKRAKIFQPEQETKSVPLESLKDECEEYKDYSFHSSPEKTIKAQQSPQYSSQSNLKSPSPEHQTPNSQANQNIVDDSPNESIPVELSPDHACTIADQSIEEELEASKHTTYDEEILSEAPQISDEVPKSIQEQQVSTEKLSMVKVSQLVDNTTQTSGRIPPEQPKESYRTEQNEPSSAIQTEKFEPEPTIPTNQSFDKKQDESMPHITSGETMQFASFVPIHPDEIELASMEVNGNTKLQAVMLPFESERGVKVAIKCIRLDSAKFQNELIHIELELTKEQLLESNRSSAIQLLEKVQIDDVTGNLSLPLESKSEIALFTMEVPKDGDQHEYIEVMAMVEYDDADSSQGKVTVQAVINAKNKVSIPMKRQAKKAKLNDIKKNLLKHLPRIVRVNDHDHVYLTQGSHEKRIGRVLPHGNSVAEHQSSSQTTSRLYQAEKTTFRSQIDKDLCQNEIIRNSARKSVATQEVFNAQRHGFVEYEDQYQARSEQQVSNCQAHDSKRSSKEASMAQSLRTELALMMKEKGITYVNLKEERAEDQNIIPDQLPVTLPKSTGKLSNQGPSPADSDKNATREAYYHDKSGVNEIIDLDYFNEISSIQSIPQLSNQDSLKKSFQKEAMTHRLSKIVIQDGIAEASKSDISSIKGYYKLQTQTNLLLNERPVIPSLPITSYDPPLTTQARLSSQKTSSEHKHYYQTAVRDVPHLLFKLKPPVSSQAAPTAHIICEQYSPRCGTRSEIVLDDPSDQQRDGASSHNSLIDESSVPSQINAAASYDTPRGEELREVVKDGSTRLEVNQAHHLVQKRVVSRAEEVTVQRQYAQDSPRYSAQSDILDYRVDQQISQNEKSEQSKQISSIQIESFTNEQFSQIPFEVTSQAKIEPLVKDEETVVVQQQAHNIPKKLSTGIKSYYYTEHTDIKPGLLESPEYITQSEIFAYNFQQPPEEKSLSNESHHDAQDFVESERSKSSQKPVSDEQKSIKDEETIQVRNRHTIEKRPTDIMSQGIQELTVINQVAPDSPRYTQQSDILKYDFQNLPSEGSPLINSQPEASLEAVSAALASSHTKSKVEEETLQEDETLEKPQIDPYLKQQVQNRSYKDAEATVIHVRAPDSPKHSQQSDILKYNFQLAGSDSNLYESVEEIPISVASFGAVSSQKAKTTKQDAQSIRDESTVHAIHQPKISRYPTDIFVREIAQNTMIKVASIQTSDVDDAVPEHVNSIGAMNQCQQSDINQYNGQQYLTEKSLRNDSQREIQVFVESQDSKSSRKPSIADKISIVDQKQLAYSQNESRIEDMSVGQSYDRSLRSLLCLQLASEQQPQLTQEPKQGSEHVRKSVNSASRDTELSATIEKKKQSQSLGLVLYEESIASSIKPPLAAPKVIIAKKTTKKSREKHDIETVRQSHQHVSWVDEEQSSMKSFIVQEMASSALISSSKIEARPLLSDEKRSFQLQSLMKPDHHQDITMVQSAIEAATERQHCVVGILGEDSGVVSSIQLPAADVEMAQAPEPKSDAALPRADAQTELNGIIKGGQSWNAESAVSSIIVPRQNLFDRSVTGVSKRVDVEKLEVQTEYCKSVGQAKNRIYENSAVSSFRIERKQEPQLTVNLNEKDEEETTRQVRLQADLQEQSQVSSIGYAPVSLRQPSESRHSDASRCSEHDTAKIVPAYSGLVEKHSQESSIKIIRKLPSRCFKQKEYIEARTECDQNMPSDKQLEYESASSIQMPPLVEQKVCNKERLLARQMTSKTAEIDKVVANALTPVSNSEISFQGIILNAQPEDTDDALESEDRQLGSHKHKLSKTLTQKTAFAHRTRPILSSESSVQSSLNFKVEKVVSDTSRELQKQRNYETQATRAVKQKQKLEKESNPSSFQAIDLGVNTSIEQFEEKPMRKNSYSCTEIQLNTQYGLDEISADTSSIPILHQHSSKPSKPTQIIRKTTKLTDLALEGQNYTMDHESQLSSLHQIEGEQVKVKVAKKEFAEMAMEAFTVKVSKEFDSDFHKEENFSATNGDYLPLFNSKSESSSGRNGSCIPKSAPEIFEPQNHPIRSATDLGLVDTQNPIITQKTTTTIPDPTTDKAKLIPTKFLSKPPPAGTVARKNTTATCKAHPLQPADEKIIQVVDQSCSSLHEYHLADRDQIIIQKRSELDTNLQATSSGDFERAVSQSEPRQSPAEVDLSRYLEKTGHQTSASLRSKQDHYQAYPKLLDHAPASDIDHRTELCQAAQSHSAIIPKSSPVGR